MALLIGMNSGSSFDGIDAVLLEIELGPDGQPARPRYHRRPGLRLAERGRGADPSRSSRTRRRSSSSRRINYVAGRGLRQGRPGAHRADRHRPGDRAAHRRRWPDDLPGAARPAADPATSRSDADLVDLWLDGPYACGLFIGESGVIAAATGIPDRHPVPAGGPRPGRNGRAADAVPRLGRRSATSGRS